MKYKGFEIKITDCQGNGSFASPLCNTPYGYEIWSRGRMLYQRVKSNSIKGNAFADAEISIDRYLERGEL